MTGVPARDRRAWGEQAIRGPVARLAARLQALIGRDERRPVDRLPDLPIPLRRSPLAVPYLDAARESDHRRAGAAASNASEQSIEARAWWAADAWAHRALWHFERVDMALAATRLCSAMRSMLWRGIGRRHATRRSWFWPSSHRCSAA